ncbi:DUF1326 domain-containing protein [Bradyrhizobium sp. WSM2793]|uniref:DUF1326 domain-containing protein n=1 Tax=Bradyrhizobium sp. WSM2793 TaxID=1038866 RepID=UPI00035E6D7C|nr:DUF1326 domain-containing protein [Bradyrhizobium sp. WSM2793]
MAASDWRLEGEWMKNCTCAFGCPCDFNARPTQGYCKGMVAMRIANGHFEGTRLDGLCFAITVDFPGPLHEGNGTIQPIIDERATAEQRQALFDIFSGKHSAEGTLFQIVSMIVTKIHDPVFAPFEFSFDKEGRVAKLVARGVLETDVEPIKNPVTGDPHRIQVVMPEGFEHRAAEVASANIRSTGAIPFETRGTHSSLANVVQTPEGVAA